jgi:hypothetical protein
MLCVLRRSEVFQRMKLKPLNITNLLPIKIMHWPERLYLIASGFRSS